MDHHKINHSNKIGGEISSGGVPFSIDVKGGEKKREHDDSRSMNVAINDKEGDY